MAECENSLNFFNKLERVQVQFLCCTPVRKIEWHNLLNLITWDQQHELMNKTVLLDLLNAYDLSKSYKIAFLRHIIETIETNNEEVHNIIYETYVNLKTADQQDESYSFKHYKLINENTLITLKESRSVIEQGTTGLCSWQAACALAEWSLINRPKFQNKKVIELGSGIGLAGFVISMNCSPNQMVLTDGNSMVLTRLRDNFEINFKSECNQPITHIEYLDWNCIDTSDILSKIRPDIIIASDVVYDETLFEPLSNTIKHFFDSNRNCCLILACTIRNQITLDRFLEIIDHQKYHRIEEQIVQSETFYWDHTVPIKIFTITR